MTSQKQTENRLIDVSQLSAPYQIYVLTLLVLVYVVNFVDRQILAILSEEIKRDLSLSDAQMGLLLGTAFAIFYAVFGIPLARIADLWNRRNLIAIGLTSWSVMTALSCVAKSIGALTLVRIGVGVGEASASPAIYSLLCDYFPKRLRSTVVSIYSSGIFVGAGLGLFLGGWLSTSWNNSFPDPATAPFGLKGWQVAFLGAGMPGLIMAALVLTIREPLRGMRDKVEHQKPDAEQPSDARHPLVAAAQELASLLPLMSLFVLGKLGGARALWTNLIYGAGIALGSFGLILVTGSVLHWAILGVGAYCCVSWAHTHYFRDAEGFESMFRSRRFMFAVFGLSGCLFITNGMLAWLPAFFQRSYGASAAEVGRILGLSFALAGFIGIVFGGAFSDFLARWFGDRARLTTGLIALVLGPFTLLAIIYLASDIKMAYALTFPFHVFSAMWIGPGAAHVLSVVDPSRRAIAAAVYTTIEVFLGLAMGPYAIGFLSDEFATMGYSSAASLERGMVLALLVSIPAAISLVVAISAMKKTKAVPA